MVNVLLDSGAFSSWKLGKVMDIDAYADYLIRNKNNFVNAINLDVIPGKFGRVPSNEEVEHSAQKSWESLKYLESRGVNPLPVFHQGEGCKWLKKIVEEGYEYVCISPDNGKATKQKQDWLDIVFTILSDDNGLPIIKTHGLAVTSYDLMFRYSWATVDSATWIVVGAYGGTFVPKQDLDGNPDYSQSPYVVFLTKKSKSNLESGMHLDSFSDKLKEYILGFFEQERIPLSELQDDCAVRSRICLRVLKRTNDLLVNPVFKTKTNNFFAQAKCLGHLKPGIAIPKTEIYYALSCAAIYSDALTIENLPNRLFTYNILRDKEEDFLDFYAQNGVFPRGKCWKRWHYAD